MMPMVGAKPHLGDHVGVGAVDDELQAAAHELVLDGGELVVERQQPVPARLLGKADELGDAPAEIRRLGAEDLLVERRDRLDAIHARPHDRHAERAAEDDHHRRRVEHRHDGGALHRRSERKAADGDRESYGR
jgi:hypothetical protein